MDREDHVGLCLDCRHSRRVATPRATYFLCERAATDSRFDKYPRLPVINCPGYEPITPGEPPASG